MNCTVLKKEVISSGSDSMNNYLYRLNPSYIETANIYTKEDGSIHVTWLEPDSDSFYGFQELMKACIFWGVGFMLLTAAYILGVF